MAADDYARAAFGANELVLAAASGGAAAPNAVRFSDLVPKTDEVPHAYAWPYAPPGGRDPLLFDAQDVGGIPRRLDPRLHRVAACAPVVPRGEAQGHPNSFHLFDFLWWVDWVDRDGPVARGAHRLPDLLHWHALRWRFGVWGKEGKEDELEREVREVRRARALSEDPFFLALAIYLSVCVVQFVDPSQAQAAHGEARWNCLRAALLDQFGEEGEPTPARLDPPPIPGPPRTRAEATEYGGLKERELARGAVSLVLDHAWRTAKGLAHVPAEASAIARLVTPISPPSIERGATVLTGWRIGWVAAAYYYPLASAVAAPVPPEPAAASTVGAATASSTAGGSSSRIRRAVRAHGGAPDTRGASLATRS